MGLYIFFFKYTSYYYKTTRDALPLTLVLLPYPSPTSSLLILYSYVIISKMANGKITVLFFWVDEDRTSIDQKCLRLIENEVKGLSGKKLFLVIQTNGGDPFSAVRIMRILQEKYEKILTIVPSHAMSAGTLMALGTDEIYMQHKSMLGPLDLPMEHPTDGSRISALDINNTITAIAGLADSIASDRYKFLRGKKLGKNEAANLAFESATKLVEPVLQKIDPYHLQKSVRELKIGWWYAYDLLTSRMMATNSTRAWDTAKKLVNFFPAHEYGIFASDAKDLLRLNVKDLEKLPEWKTIKPRYDEISLQGKDAIIIEEMELNPTPSAKPTTT